MIKLSFDYDSALNCQVAYVPGFRIRAVQDSDAENPWNAWDCQAPLLVLSDRSIQEYGDIPNPIGQMRGSFIARNWKALAAIFDQSADAAREYKTDWEYDRIADARRDLLEEWLSDAKGGSLSDYMNINESLFALMGWPVYLTTSRGYSQSDWAELLLVYTPAHALACGIKFPRSAKAKAAAVKSLEADAKLWGNWAWGNVYGAVIDAWEGGESDGRLVEHAIESCWGFYGDPDESGLADFAESTIDAIRSQRKAARLAKLKEIIRARVPVAIRADILERFPL